MKILTLIQGTTDWQSHRATARNASEVPAVMGFGKYKTRSELLREKHSGVAQSVDANTQRLFDRGHAAEAAARPNVELLINDELFPITATSDDDYLSASYDGITMCEGIFWENKLFNKDLAAYIDANQDLPDSHWPQVEQQYMISKAHSCLFTLCDEQGNIKTQLRYESRPERQQAVLSAWAQFDEDLANYQHVEVATEAVGRVPDALPALRIEVTGMVTNSNLEAFRAGAELMFSKINRDLQTDQDFADAEKTVKHCKEVEDNIEAAKKHALSQTASIDELYRALDSVSAQARTVRLELDRLVKARKENIRIEIQQDAEIAFKAHIDTINARLGKVQLPAIKTDFAGAMKGKKTVASLRDAVDTELARVKIEASQLSELMGANVNSLRDLAVGYEFLFMDAQQICQKQNDDLLLLIKSRIDGHKTEEQKRIDAEVAKQVEAAKAEANPVAEPVVIAPVVESSARKIQVTIDGKPATHDEVADAVGLSASKRPTDNQIIFAVATQFNVDFHTAAGWIKEIDFSEMRNVA